MLVILNNNERFTQLAYDIIIFEFLISLLLRSVLIEGPNIFDDFGIEEKSES